jgi:LmbE family N-acetylglucosaminyl deacetylase
MNFFTVSAYAPRAGQSETEAASLIRKTEDRRVLSRIDRNILVRDFDLLDAPLRLGISSDAVFRREAQELASTSEPQVAALIRKHASRVLIVAPLGLGGHVDHFVVHNAAIRSCSPIRLAFYEDLPYATWTQEDALRQRIRETEAKTGMRLTPAIIRQASAFYRKQRVVAAYRSQISLEEAASIARFAAKYGGGERLWIPKHGQPWALLTSAHARQSASTKGHS